MEEESESSESVYTEIEINTSSLDNSVIFNVIKNIIGFILYMHQQIPSVLQDMNVEFDSLKEECKEMMATAQTEAKGCNRRTHMSRMREVRVEIKRFEKLMNAISEVESALKLMIVSEEIPCLEKIFILIIGANPIRPHHVYELSFSYSNSVLSAPATSDFATSKAAEALSRKAIRALIAKGAGSGNYPGPSKLFLLVKAPSSLNLPLHFLPKRDFKYSKKIVPIRLRVKSKSQELQMETPDRDYHRSSSISLEDSASNELIWFQCRHVVKGLSFMNPTEE